jgi:hypothetical protein
MGGLNIVELGNVSEETRGTMIFGISDPGGLHYFYFPGAVQVRKMSDVKVADDDGSARSRTGT